MHLEAQFVADVPVYGYSQAAHYVGVPVDTLRGWIGEGGLIQTPLPDALSFSNLAEAHILKAMRKVHGLSLQQIRKALAELKQLHPSAHPLLEKEFETDGVSLCVREKDAVINLSKRSQQEFKEFVSLYLHRIQRDGEGRVARLYPFVVADREGEPKHISISPTVSFGKPVLTGTGISTSIIVGRFNARDSVEDLAREYGVQPAVLEDAIRWELNKGRAA